MNKRLLLLAAVLACAALGAGCGGGANAPMGSAVNYVPSPMPSVSGIPVQFSITIPNASSSTAARRPEFTSSGTQSVSVTLAAVDGQAVAPQSSVVIDVAANSSNCTATAGGRVCTGTITGAAGTDAFTIALYASTNGSGNVLADGTVETNVASSGGSVSLPNALSVTLNPVMASLEILVSPASLQGGKKTKGTAFIEPLDASGEAILGVLPPTLITLSLGGAGSSVTFGKNQTSTTVLLNAPVNFYYDGSLNVGTSVTLQASLQSPGQTLNASLQIPIVIPPTPTPSPTPTGLVPALYVLNQGQSGNPSTVTVYPLTASGNAAPVRTIQLNASMFPESIAVDSSGQLRVGYEQGEIDTYAYNANGSDVPIAQLTGNSNNQIEPVQITFDPLGDLVTIGYSNLNSVYPATAALVFKASASGSASPINAWNFSSPYIALGNLADSSVAGLATDASGNFYVDGALAASALSSAPGIYVAASTASTRSQNAAREIQGNATTTIPTTPYTGTVAGLALDANGVIYESQYGNAQNVLPGAINVFPAGASGGITNTAPIATITGTPLNIVVGSGLVAGLPIAVYGQSLFAANASTNTVLVYPTSANGNATPAQTISGSATQLSNPVAIAIGLSASQ